MIGEVLMLVAALAAAEEEELKKKEKKRKEQRRLEREKEAARQTSKTNTRERMESSYDSPRKQYINDYLICGRYNGYIVGKKYGLLYMLDSDGFLINNEGYDDLMPCRTGHAIVKKNNKYNVLNSKGRLLSDEWYEAIDLIDIDGFLAMVKNDDKYHLINGNGQRISKDIYDPNIILHSDYKIVFTIANGKYNLKNRKDNTLFSKEGYENLNDLIDAVELLEVKKLLEEIRLDKEKYGKITRLSFPGLIIEENGHKAINPLFIKLGVLPHVNFNDVSFKGVSISGIDFRGCSMPNFNPQEVYDKNLENCNFEGMEFGPLVNFSGVNIKGARFSWDQRTFCNAIYDETTLIAGELPLTEIYGPCEEIGHSK